MRKLANLIQDELKQQEVCAVYDAELERLWPRTMSTDKRKEQIVRFAKQHELDVTFYDVGLCAIFEKAGAQSRDGRRVPSRKQADGRRPRKERA